MLVMLVSHLARSPALHGWNEHAVKINEAQLAVLNDDVAVLQVAVSNARFAQSSNQLDPLVREMKQDFALLYNLVEINIERWTFYPLHDQNGVAASGDEYALR